MHRRPMKNSRNFTRWLVLQHTLRLENLSPVTVNTTASAMSMPATVWVAPNDNVIQRSWLGCVQTEEGGSNKKTTPISNDGE